jgi:hypothetical protein
MMIPRESYLATLEFTYSCSTARVAHKAVAELLAQELGGFHYDVKGIDDERDEEITWIELANIPPFVVQVGLLEHPRQPDRMLAQLYPPLPYVRVWLRKVSTGAVVARLSSATTTILEASCMCKDVRWLKVPEIRELWSAVHRPVD